MYAVYNLIPTDPARQELEPMRQSLQAEEYALTSKPDNDVIYFN